ncbi:segregation/condensation protein A [Candidatus Wolfebacteria bacterium]|nr:segregation/condensation protein A [Candidatus Wolfebacteria bacterium]
MTANNFQIKTESFEGPFDLLVSLIEKRKLHVSDVSLAQVADDYIQYVHKQTHFPVEETAQFILIAATLLLIKSKNLLPVLDLSTEEEGDVVELENRLRLYKKYRRIALLLWPHWGKNKLYERSFVPAKEPMFVPDDNITSEVLEGSLHIFLKKARKQFIALPKAKVKEVISIEDMMESLSKRIQSSLSMSFKDFSRIGKAEKIEVVVSFLAMLELVKRGALSVVQQGTFQDIELSTTSVSSPKYN